MKRSSKKRGINFLLTLGQMQALLDNVGEKCPSCCRQYVFMQGCKLYPSIDRIDHLKDYELDNVKVICMGCNNEKARTENPQCALGRKKIGGSQLRRYEKMVRWMSVVWGGKAEVVL